MSRGDFLERELLLVSLMSRVMCELRKVSTFNTLHNTFSLDRYFLLGVWRMSGGCLEDVWRVFEGYLEGFGKVSGGCLEDIQKVSGGNLECVRKVTGRSQDCVWRLSGRCLENIKIVLLVWRIREVLLALFFPPYL